jgi:hypothetical protein
MNILTADYIADCCFHSIQNHSSSHLLTENMKIKIYKTVILHLVLYGYEMLSLIVQKEQSLGTYQNRILRKIYGPKKEDIM